MTETVKPTPQMRKDMIALFIGAASAGTFIAASAIQGVALPLTGLGLAGVALVIKMVGNSSSSEPTSGKKQRPNAPFATRASSASGSSTDASQDESQGRPATAHGDDKAVA